QPAVGEQGGNRQRRRDGDDEQHGTGQAPGEIPLLEHERRGLEEKSKQLFHRLWGHSTCVRRARGWEEYGNAAGVGESRSCPSNRRVTIHRPVSESSLL